MKPLLLTVAILLFGFGASRQTGVGTGVEIVQGFHEDPVPTGLRRKLPAAADLAASLTLPNQDHLVEYDTVRITPENAGSVDNHPHVAILRRGVVIFDLDLSADVAFHGTAVSRTPSGPVAAAIALTLGTDSSGTLFVFIGQNARTYRVLGRLTGAQAQVRFIGDLAGKFELWSADGWVGHSLDATCVWCPKYYKRTVYEWRNGKLRQVSSSRQHGAHDPYSFFEKPFISTKRSHSDH